MAAGAATVGRLLGRQAVPLDCRGRSEEVGGGQRRSEEVGGGRRRSEEVGAYDGCTPLRASKRKSAINTCP